MTKEQDKKDHFESVEAVGHLQNALHGSDNPGVFLAALRTIIETHENGMNNLSKETNLNRQNLYRMLSKEGNPTLKSLYLVLDSIGLKLSVTLKVSHKTS